MPYKYSSEFDIFQRSRINELLTMGAAERWSASRMTTMLSREDLSYRRENMLVDYRRAQVVSASKDIFSEARANSFFDNTYEPFRKEHGYTASKMGEIMSAFKREAEIPPELQEAVDEWDDWLEEIGT